MVFNEIYSAYYKTVAQIIKFAIASPVDAVKIRETAKKYAFSESPFAIETAIKEQRWQLILPDGTTPLKSFSEIPVTLLQKRWLKAISLDRRVQLFDCDFKDLEEIEPLFTEDDYFVFDMYHDGDDFKSESYKKNFRIILSAIHNKDPLDITIKNRKGNESTFSVMPERLEYSEKDDKFRLLTSGNRTASVINLGRIESCSLHVGEFPDISSCRTAVRKRTVTMELVDERNAPERVLLHFSHFEKRAEKLDNGRYRLTIRYDKSDETEILIRILSFGPLVRVTEPPAFVNLIRSRLKSQLRNLN